MCGELTCAGAKALEKPRLVFNSQCMQIRCGNNLRALYEWINGYKAVNTDGGTKEQCGRHPAENLGDLSNQLKEMGNGLIF